MNAIENLQYLVGRGFRGVPVRDAFGEIDALLYAYLWRSGVLDVLIMYSVEEALAYRIGGVDTTAFPTTPTGSVQWRYSGAPDDVTQAVVELPPVDEGGLIDRLPRCVPSWLWRLESG